MSTRWYPRYVRGNPQLRVFLPDFWMILKKPDAGFPPNKLVFKVPPQMTKFDVKNYLERIYKFPVVDVQSRVVCGAFKLINGRVGKRAVKYMAKEDDYREAIVDLPKDFQFKYPDLFPEEVENIQDEMEKFYKQYEFVKNKEKRRLFVENRRNVPNWFGL